MKTSKMLISILTLITLFLTTAIPVAADYIEVKDDVITTVCNSDGCYELIDDTKQEETSDNQMFAIKTLLGLIIETAGIVLIIKNGNRPVFLYLGYCLILLGQVMIINLRLYS